MAKTPVFPILQIGSDHHFWKNNLFRRPAKKRHWLPHSQLKLESLCFSLTPPSALPNQASLLERHLVRECRGGVRAKWHHQSLVFCIKTVVAVEYRADIEVFLTEMINTT